jgi:hypothetical protein
MSNSLPIIITGGARAGRSHSSWPFAKLTIEKDTLYLEVPSHSDFVFSAKEELTICVEKHMLFRLPIGIRIHHQQGDTPQPIVFWYLRPQKLMNILRGTDFAEKIGV